MAKLFVKNYSKKICEIYAMFIYNGTALFANRYDTAMVFLQI